MTTKRKARSVEATMKAASSAKYKFAIDADASLVGRSRKALGVAFNPATGLLQIQYEQVELPKENSNEQENQVGDPPPNQTEPRL